MKIKSLLVLAILLLYSIAVIAQLPVQNSINNTYLNKNKSLGNPTFNLLSNGTGTFNSFGESNLLLIKTR